MSEMYPPKISTLFFYILLQGHEDHVNARDQSNTVNWLFR